MRLRKTMNVLAAAVVATTATLVVSAQPAAAVTYLDGPVYSDLSIQRGTEKRAMAILNASTGNTAPMVHAPYTAPAPFNDYMRIEVEPGDWARIKPWSTYSNDGDVHNDKCLSIKNNDIVENQPIVNATCSYDSVNNDVWKMTRATDTGGTYYIFEHSGTHYAITVDKPSSNGALFLATRRTIASYWRR